jgi:crossover junction endodeoxyribonuclease RuvC
MSAPIFLAIDIGLTGAIARVDADKRLIGVDDLPVLADGPACRRTINGPLLAELVFKSHAIRAFVETVGPRPGEGAVGAFAFGRSRGIIEGVLAAAGVSVTWIAPARWKRAVGIPPGQNGAKDAARSKAIAIWPSEAAHLARVKDHGRAEACLIGVAGLLLEARREGGAA